MSRANKIIIVIIGSAVILSVVIVGITYKSKVASIWSDAWKKGGQSQLPGASTKPTMSLSAVGVIQSIDNQVITFKAPAGSNSAFDVDKIFKSEVSDQTEILEQRGAGSLDVTSQGENKGVEVQIKNKETGETVATSKKLALVDLKVGSWALFVSDKNLLDNDSFVAQKIYSLIPQ